MTYEEIRKNHEVNTYISQADLSLSALGFTEHSFAHCTMVAEKDGANTNSNNYLGGGVNSANGKTNTSSRFYAHSKLTITPAAGYEIETIAFECTTDNYATNLANSSWPNATAAKSGTTVTITAIDAEKGRLKVRVEETPIELGFDQVETI